MAGNIKGIIVEIGGDTSNLQKALNKVNSTSSSLSKELKGINSLLKLDPKNTELLNQKQIVLNKSIETTKEKLNKLKEIQSKALEEGIDKNEEQQENWRALQREILNTQNKLNKFLMENSKWSQSGKSIEEYAKKIDNINNKLNNVGNSLSKKLTTSILGFSALAIKCFKELDEGIDNVIKKTGATGEVADNLKAVYKEVAGNVKGEFTDVGNAVGDLNTRFGFTNDILKKSSEDFLKFAEVNNVDVSEAIQKVSRYMGDASIESSKYFEVLDDLTSVAQASGINMNNLTEMLTKYGAPMRALGLTTKESIAIFAGWEKAGVNTEIAFSGMKKAIGTWGKEGKNSTEEFKKTLDEIKKCPDIASATTKAIEIFGQKAGPDLADAIRGGRFEYAEFLKILDTSNGTLEKTYDGIIDNADKAKITLKKLKIEFADVGAEILNSAAPSVETIITNIKNLIKNFNKLDPKLKKNIINISAIATVIGPGLILFSKLFGVISSGVKTVGLFTQAIGVLKTGTLSTNSSVNTLANTIKNMTNPLGVATLAIAAVTAEIAIMDKKLGENLKKTKEYTQAIKDTINSRKDLSNSQIEQMNGNISEINYIKNLNEELKNIVDQNGKVKEGYQERAKFILNELNNALDTEYKLNSNIIDSYQAMQKEIDNLINKKRAQIVIETQEEQYREAIKNKTKDYQDLISTQDKLAEAQQRRNEAEKEFLNAQLYGGNAISTIKYQKAIEEVNELIDTYNKQKEVIESNNIAINKYEKNIELMAQGTEESYNKIYQSINEVQTSATSIQQTEMAKRIEDLQQNLKETKKIYDLESEYNKNAKENIYKLNLEESQKNLELTIEELKKMTSTTGEMSPDVIQAWKNLADNSREEYNKAVLKMPQDMQDRINNITEVVRNDLSVREATSFLGNEAIKGFDKSKEAEQAGKNLIAGINQGINNQTEQAKVKDSAFNFSKVILGIIRGVWKINSPSEETTKDAIYLLQGISKGAKKESAKTYKDIENISNNILKKFNSSLDVNSLQKIPNLQSNISQIINTQLKPKILQPNIVINTQKLDNAEMNKIIDTLNRRFGMQF